LGLAAAHDGGFLAALVALSYGIGGPLARDYAAIPPTRVQAAQYLRSRYDPTLTSVLTWNGARVIRWYAPEWSTRIVSVPPGTLRPGERLLVLSDYPDLTGVKRGGYSLRRVERIRRSRYLHTWFHDLTLFEAVSGNGTPAPARR
jgi:hypothetical protein